MRRSSTSTCNKCKHGVAQEGDTWCLGCSSLDLGQDHLKRSWYSPAVRAVVEESCLSAARYIRALWTLDRSLAAHDQVQSSANRSTAPKVLPAPPRSSGRSRSRERPSREPARDVSAGVRHLPAPRSDRAEDPLPTGDSYEYSESEEEGETHTGAAGSAVHPRREENEAPPEPARPPSGSHGSRPPPPKKKTRRGGKKHQKHTQKGLTDPFKRTHRSLRGESLSLAPNFKAGLERRA